MSLISLTNTAILALAVSCGGVACFPSVACLDGSEHCNRASSGANDGSDASADGAVDPNASALTCTLVGKPHIGLGNEDVAAKTDGSVVDRGRAKPYSALVTEYPRVLGPENKSSLLDTSGGTFGQPNDRWYVEPLASAVFINTAFNVAFEGCLHLTGDIAGGTAGQQYAVAPTSDSAKVECTAWARRFWSRDATAAEVDSCVGTAMDLTSETYGGGATPATTRETSPQRRWAYACASVLTAAGFLTY